MGFLNPWVLGGLAAVGVPIAIHLLNKFRVQRTRWAAMRFVQDSLKKNRQRLQFEDLILLILRCLVVVALAIAFARPVLKALVQGGAAAIGDGPAVTAVVLDNSASMGQSNGVSSRFDDGRKGVRELLDRASAGSQLAFFLVSNRADALIAKPAADLPRFRRSLELAELSDRSTNLAQGIRAAYESVKPFAGQRREILVYTDSQAPAWKGLDAIRKLQEANPDILLKPMVLGQSGEDNLAIIGLQAEGGVPAAGQPCRFRVDVANYGTKPAESVRVTISADDQAPSDESLLPRIEPGATQSVNLFVRLDTPGFHAVKASIPPDRLPVDNERATALQVVDRMGVLIVEGSSQAPAAERDGYFLANALAPISSDRKKSYYLNINTVPFASIGKVSFPSYDTVFLCNPGAITDQTATALKNYVSAGGNLVVFPGAKTDPAAWKKSAVFAELLPAVPGPKRTGVQPPVSLQTDGFDHPVTAIWNDRSEGGLGAVKYTEYFPLELKQPTGQEAKPSVVLRLSNNDAAAVEWSYGQGKVVIFNAPATPQGNNLMLHPGFVALTQRLMGYLNRGSSARLVLGPGETFEIPVAMELLGKDFSIIRPGKDTSKRPAGRVELSDQRSVLRYRDTDTVGSYRIFVGQDNHPSAVFAVQMDPAESDLRQANAQEIESLARPPESSGEAAAAQTSAPRLQVKTEFWTLFIWLAALLALAEAVLAHRMSQSR